MWLTPGKRISLTLTDGTTFEGTARFTWAFWRTVRLVDVAVPGSLGVAEVEGEIRIPRHSLVYVQVVG